MKQFLVFIGMTWSVLLLILSVWFALVGWIFAVFQPILWWFYLGDWFIAIPVSAWLTSYILEL